MAIPKISRANVLAAIEHIKREGVPSSRRSTRYALMHEGRRFPPKYVISMAVKDATGVALDPQEFGGGVETNSFLRNRGFSVVAFSRGAADTQQRPSTPPVSKRETEMVAVHSKAEPEAPVIGRVVVGCQASDPAKGEGILIDVLTNQWPEGLQLKFLITPGGFIVAPFPTNWSGGIGWGSVPTDLDALRTYAEPALSRTVTHDVLRVAEGKIDILTVGVDLLSDDRQERAELVAVYDIISRRVFWTGKSYPTSNEERDLVQVVDLDTHLLKVADERVLVLGCHDLNMFSPRGWANQAQDGVRRQRCKQIRQLAHRFEPTIVLHHPHSTDTPNIWRTAWGGLKRELPGLKAWASGIAYHHSERRPRVPLEDVLIATCPSGERVAEKSQSPHIT